METIRTGARSLFATAFLAALAIVLIVVVLPAILAAAGTGAG